APVVARNREFGSGLDLIGKVVEKGRGRFAREVDFAFEVAIGDLRWVVHIVVREIRHTFPWVSHTLNLAPVIRSVGVTFIGDPPHCRVCRCSTCWEASRDSKSSVNSLPNPGTSRN